MKGASPTLIQRLVHRVTASRTGFPCSRGVKDTVHRVGSRASMHLTLPSTAGPGLIGLIKPAPSTSTHLTRPVQWQLLLVKPAVWLPAAELAAKGSEQLCACSDPKEQPSCEAVNSEPQPPHLRLAGKSALP